eukprot:363828-Chlamydomonas_euryale.AAC.14
MVDKNIKERSCAPLSHSRLDNERAPHFTFHLLRPPPCPCADLLAILSCAGALNTADLPSVPDLCYRKLHPCTHVHAHAHQRRAVAVGVLCHRRLLEPAVSGCMCVCLHMGAWQAANPT